jgi:CubicO group peptidase (beta-lactamase class C family)
MARTSYLKIYILLILCGFLTIANAQSPKAKIQKLLENAYAKGEFSGVALIAKGDKIIYKGAVGLANREWKIPNTVNTKIRLCSVTKQFTAMLTMQLVAEGKLNLDKTVSDYLPDYRQDTGSKIRLRDLLNSASGLPTFDDLAFYQSDDEKLTDVNYVVKNYLSGDLTFEPSTKFNYNNADFIILGAIIEKVLGKSFEQNLRERIFTPLGMKNSGVYTQEIVENQASGYYRKDGRFIIETPFRMQNYQAAASAYSTIDDMFLWDRALLTNKLLSKDLTREMFTPSPKLYFVALGSWAYNLKLSDGKEHRMVERQGNVGGFCNLNIIAPDDDWSLVLFSNTETQTLFRTYGNEGLSAEILNILAK